MGGSPNAPSPPAAAPPSVVNLPQDLLVLQEDLLTDHQGLQVPFHTISQFLVSDQSFAQMTSLLGMVAPIQPSTISRKSKNSQGWGALSLTSWLHTFGHASSMSSHSTSALGLPAKRKAPKPTCALIGPITARSSEMNG